MRKLDCLSAWAAVCFSIGTVSMAFGADVIEQPGRDSLPPAPGIRKGAIRHIVWVVKGNRTFDEVFGQMEGVRGNPALAELGLKRTVLGGDGTRPLRGVDVSPNHHALAAQFAISDNFHFDAALDPKALWEHLARHNAAFFNFGLGADLPALIAEQVHKETGVRPGTNGSASLGVASRYTSRNYPGPNPGIPDQFRIDRFEEEFRRRWETAREPFPRLITVALSNDRLPGEDRYPREGYPFRESYMADNDLALGRLVQKLSRTRYWKEMLIIVTEGEAGGGKDHVDARRSILMLIGPHVKKGYVSHTRVNTASIRKMILTLLDLPELNPFDAAWIPYDIFAREPDFRAYTPRPVDPRLFDPERVPKPFDRRFNWRDLLDAQGTKELRDPERAHTFRR